MTKAEFLERLARDEKIGSKKDAADALDAVLGTITEVMGDGGEVSFTGFGKFSVSHRAARQGVNPQTKEKIQIQASKVPKFSAGSALKKAVKS